MRTVYTPMSGSSPPDGVVVVAKTIVPPASLAATARESVRASGRKVLVGSVRTMEGQINDSIGQERGLAWLSAAFAALAAILACVGLYGVMSYQVTRRTREIGIRLAIGARPATVLGTVLGQSLALAATGIGIGLVAAWFASGLVSAFLFGLSPRDPVTLSGVALTLVLTAAAAAYLPARRAARVDPLSALRTD
jgi:ABC-type antimicrobial peptide transport system permease subunit